MKTLIKEIEDKIHEIEVTKDNTPHWNGVRDGLAKSIKIIRNHKPKKSKPTAKTLEAESFVDRFIEQNGYPPTYREVAHQLNLASTNTAYHRLRNYRHRMKNKLIKKKSIMNTQEQNQKLKTHIAKALLEYAPKVPVQLLTNKIWDIIYKSNLVTVEEDGVTIAEEPILMPGCDKNCQERFKQAKEQHESKEKITHKEHNKRLLQRLSEAEATIKSQKKAVAYYKKKYESTKDKLQQSEEREKELINFIKDCDVSGYVLNSASDNNWHIRKRELLNQTNS